MKIAIVYICTGDYSIFWKNFFETSEQYLYPSAPSIHPSIHKDYFVFTDDNNLITQLEPLPNVKTYFQKRAGWPYDTLLRFNTFCTIQDVLMGYDYCYYWNANTYFVKEITPDVIPFPTKEQGLILWRHTLTYDCNTPEGFQAEKNPNSTAYIAPNTPCREYGGGFLGGTPEAFIAMSQTLRDNIATDLSHGIIAIWHDQSHLQNYALSHSCVEVPRYVICSEEYVDTCATPPYAIFANKQRYGGMHKLRNMPLQFRLKVYLQRKVVRTLKPFVFKALKCLGIYWLIRKIYRLIKKK